MRQSYADHRESVIFQTQKPNIQLSHQIHRLSVQYLANTISVAVYEKQSLSFSHQFHLQTVYCAFHDSDYGSNYLVLAAQSSSPENRFNH